MAEPRVDDFLGNIPERGIRAASGGLCPVLCPPPNSTECYGVLSMGWKALLGKASVALRNNSSRSVQIADSVCGNGYESCVAVLGLRTAEDPVIKERSIDLSFA